MMILADLSKGYQNAKMPLGCWWQ